MMFAHNMFRKKYEFKKCTSAVATFSNGKNNIQIICPHA